MTLDTTQRVMLAVPVPRTELTIGQFFESSRTDASGQTITSQYSGVSVYTAEDIRFNAMGTWSIDSKESDLIAQSKGQLWMQAIGKVAGLAGTNMLVSSSSSTMIAGQGGVTILSGFRPGSITPEPEAGTFPSAIESYESTAKIPTMIWGIFDTVMAVGLTALDAYLRISDRPSGKSGYDAWGVVGGLANLAGATINIAGLTGATDIPLPGINMFSQAGTLIATPMGAVNIVGVPGLLIASTFTTQFGLLVSGVRGLFSAGMTSLKTADVSAILDVTVRASQDLTLASRTGEVSGRGATMRIGNVAPTAAPQLPTKKLELFALEKIELSSKLEMKVDAVTLTPGSGFASKAEMEAKFDASQKIRFKSGPFEITIGPSGTTLGSSSAKISLTSTGAKVEGPGAVAKVELAATTIDLVAGAGSCKFDLAAKKLTVDGTTFDIK